MAGEDRGICTRGGHLEDSELCHKITGIIGLEDGLSVECLKGSGLIADETSRGYDDIFTITLVTVHSVGIGAYLVRLGKCAVQVEGQPFILTGALVSNKVPGREVYTADGLDRTASDLCYYTLLASTLRNVL